MISVIKVRGPQHRYLCSTTCLCMLHNMKNDYREGKKVLHLVVEESLHLSVKCVAADKGLSITEFVTSVLEREVGHGDAGTGPVDSARVGEAGGTVGSHGGGDRGGDSQPGASGRGVDWDSLLLAGKRAKLSVGSVDPIEEIA